MDICIDFDGTCVAHEYPTIGKDIGAVPVLKELVEKGHKLILFTMRSDRKKKKKIDGQETVVEENVLTEAVEWFSRQGIPLYGIQKNPKQRFWTSSPKAYGHLYIDDAALGCPLVVDDPESERPYANWKKIREMLVEQGIL
ncbi:HAD family hydrolase [Dysgonomonas sp. 511]|uniref:HAD family hydrolase n=1 Tax=Dysgonomonas sp. 511 TaxID=2302930 RepID=UPI0013D1366F|nr:HAD family hydrolase [Dysgonomonas sp. 511]NDV78341.1 HAD family hydrolase [Dysgonomonas sp. 511]